MKKYGFTLIELMVVVGIVILISSLVIVNVNQSRIKARDARRVADLGTVSSALASYYADNHFFPSSGDYNAMYTALHTPVNYLNTQPHSPSGNEYTYARCPAGCTNSGTSFCNGYVLGTTLDAMANNPIDDTTTTYTVITGESSITNACP